MTFDEFKKEWDDRKEFILAKTSGSTGNAKTIKLSKTFLKESAKRTNDFFGIDSNSRLHSCISPEFIGGKMMAVRSYVAQANLTWETPSNHPLENIDNSETLDLIALVPSQMHHLLQNVDNLPFVRNIIIGGSSIHKELKRKIAESGLNCYETYGMTETASHIALRRIDHLQRPFRLLPNIYIEKDEEDCLKIIFKDGYEIQTNDIVDIKSENEFYIKGRRDHIIISGGMKINPFEIEEKISSLIDSDFFITGIKDEKWGEKIVLVIEAPFLPEASDKLNEEFRKILKKWEVPKEIIITDKIPRTSNGKILRNILSGGSDGHFHIIL